jgi:hypothetical protein
MTEQEIDLVLDGYFNKLLNRPRSRFLHLLDFLNNFWFGFFLASFFWVLPFMELARMMGDSIALHCGVK